MQVDYIFEKGTGIMNEDFYFINGNLFGVFDGATSLSEKVYEDGYTGGFLASNIAGKIFIQNNSSLINLAGKANSAISNGMLKRGVNLKNKGNLWSTGAAVIRVYEETFQWLQTGDCLILTIYNDNTYEILTDKFDHDLETLKLWKEIAGNTDDTIMKAMKDQIKRLSLNAHKKYIIS